MTSTGASDGKNDTENHPEPSNEAIKQPTLTEKKQSLSWIGMNELQLEIQRLKSDIDTRNAYTRSLERDNAKAASVVLENEVLRKKVDELIKNLESKDTELYMLRSALASSAKTAEEAAHMRVQMEAFPIISLGLAFSMINLLLESSKHEAQADDITRTQASVNGLQIKLTAEENINKQLTTELAESEEKIKNITGVAETLRSQNKSIESKVKGLQNKVEGLEKVRDWHYKDYTQALQLCNTLKQESAMLKEEKRALAEKFASQLRDLGGFVTDLDLVAEEIRIYVCPHNNLRGIHYATAKETQIKKVWRVAGEMWKRWENEAKFLKAYETARQNILDHTRAHEVALHRNGDWWREIKAAFDELDRKRHFCTTYT